MSEVLAGQFLRLRPDGTVDVVGDVGDGLLVVSGSADIERLAEQNAARAGALYSASSGALRVASLSHNRYGLVVQDDPKPVWSEDVSLEGNSESPLLSDGNLPVPEDPPDVPEPAVP